MKDLFAVLGQHLGEDSSLSSTWIVFWQPSSTTNSYFASSPPGQTIILTVVLQEGYFKSRGSGWNKTKQNDFEVWGKRSDMTWSWSLDSEILSWMNLVSVAMRKIETELWNFGRPQPRVGDLSVAKIEKLRRKSRSEASKRGWATKRARKWPTSSHGIWIVYTCYVPGLYLVYPVWQ